jgi:hypothetical protein
VAGEERDCNAEEPDRARFRGAAKSVGLFFEMCEAVVFFVVAPEEIVVFIRITEVSCFPACAKLAKTRCRIADLSVGT